MRPPIITICGSTRFLDQMRTANRELTLNGNIVLAPGVFAHSGDEITDEQKIMLDALHFSKILMCDAIYVVNPDGYIGESTKKEIAFAEQHGRDIMYLERP